MAIAVRDTRQTILEAAAELFRKQGYAATTVQQVAELTGISKGNLTYHFASKRALFEAMHELGVAYVRDRVLIRSFNEAATFHQGLADFTRRLRRLLLDSEGRFVGCLFTNIAVETRHSDPAIADQAGQALVAFRLALAEFVAHAQEAGEIRRDLPASEVARTFFWLYEGALTLARAFDDVGEYDRFCDLIGDWFAG